MKKNNLKVLLATVFGLMVTSAALASELDYGSSALSVVYQDNIASLYEGAEADSFTFNSATYSAKTFLKVSIPTDGNTPESAIFADPFYFPANN